MTSGLISFTILVATISISILADFMNLPKTGLLLILQLAVVMVAFASNRLTAVISSFICAMAFNYFFTAPRYSFHMSDATDIADMLFFLIVALLTSQVASYIHLKRQELKQVQLRASILLSVSHDLRTPLASIIGSLTTVETYKPQLSEQQCDELINGALLQTHRLHNYIENLLQATKIQHKQLQITLSHNALFSICQEVEKRAESPRLHLINANEPIMVQAQASLLEQAIFNLVDNALKYSPDDQPVHLFLIKNKNRVEISINDQGTGISPDLIDTIFDSFVSVRIGDKGYGGSGLGLTVAKGIVEAHQGQLTIVPSKTGCCMQISLPIAEEITQ
ncbi:sensor histidine kinase [Pseudoalteromonas tunicata]|nr:ATP-binding protein [Pseudoalteromonas tunicata]